MSTKKSKATSENKIASSLADLIQTFVDDVVPWRRLAKFAVYALLIFVSVKAFTYFEHKRLNRQAATISQDIANPAIRVRSVGNTVVLEGHLHSRMQYEKAIHIAKAHKRVWTIRNVFEKPQVLSLVSIQETAPVKSAKTPSRSPARAK